MAALALAQAQAADLRREIAPDRLPPRPDPRPQIAIVIDDLGLDWGRFEAVNALPVPVTLAILPYGTDAQAMLDKAFARHEKILHLPMEAHRETAPSGPDTVLAGNEKRARKALLTNLDKLAGYRGVNNHTGSKATGDRAAMRAVLKELAERGLYFLDSRTTTNTVAKSLSAKTGATVIEGDLFLDGDLGRGGEAHVRRQLKLLERVAHQEGTAIAIGHPYPSTIKALRAWSEEAQGTFRFVTTSELATNAGYSVYASRAR